MNDLIGALTDSFRVSEISKMVGVSPLTVTRWLVSGKLASIKLPGRRIFPRAALEEFLASRSTGTSNQPTTPITTGRRSAKERKAAADAAAARCKAMGV